MLFVEATAYDGKGRLTLTGQLGEVMQESAQAALSYARAHAGELGIDRGLVPEPRPAPARARRAPFRKDGPSAGITMATAIVSLATGRPVSEEVAMTGEITLTGQVLPIGGLREKLLAAQQAEIKRVIVPRENEPDLEELPEETRRGADAGARGRHRRGDRRRARERRRQSGGPAVSWPGASRLPRDPRKPVFKEAPTRRHMISWRAILYGGRRVEGKVMFERCGGRA